MSPNKDKSRQYRSLSATEARLINRTLGVSLRTLVFTSMKSEDIDLQGLHLFNALKEMEASLGDVHQNSSELGWKG